jgi:hypothetical protein
MRSKRFCAGAVAAILLLAGCGNNPVVVDVDVRSFLDESDLVNTYNAPPLVAATARIDPIQVNLVESFEDFGDAESVTLDIAIDYVNVTGTGSGDFTLYLGDDESTLFGTTPVANLNVNLLPNTTTRGTVRIQADQRVLDLFTSQRLYLGADLAWSPSGTEPLQGDCIIAQLHARVTSRLALF